MTIEDLSPERIEDAKELIKAGLIPEDTLESFPVLDPDFVIERGHLMQMTSYVKKLENFTFATLHDELLPGNYQVRIPSTQRPFISIPIRILAKPKPAESQNVLSQAERDELIGLRIQSQMIKDQIADLKARNTRLENDLDAAKKAVPENNMVQTILTTMGAAQERFATSIGSVTGGDALVKQYQAGMAEQRKTSEQVIKSMRDELEKKEKTIEELENEIEELESQIDELKDELRGHPKEDSIQDKLLDLGTKFMANQTQQPAPQQLQRPAPQPKEVKQAPQEPQPKPQPEMSVQNQILNASIRFLNNPGEIETEAVTIADLLNSPSGLMIKGVMKNYSPEEIASYVISELRNAKVLKPDITDEVVLPPLNELAKMVKGLI